MANIIAISCDTTTVDDFELCSRTTVDTDNEREGTGCLKIACNGSIQGDQGLKSLGGNVHNVDFGGHYFHRWWMKISPTLVWSNQFKLKANRWGTALTGYLLANGVQPGEHNEGFTSAQGAGSGGEGPTISYDFDPDSNPAITDWQEYIVEYKVQSVEDATDGWMKFYVNGVLEGELTSVRWFTGSDVWFEQWGIFMVFNFPQNVAGDIWIDDASLDTTFNSNFEGGEPPAGVKLGSSLGGMG